MNQPYQKVYNYVNKIFNGCIVSILNGSNFIANWRKFIFTNVFYKLVLLFLLMVINL